MDNPVLAPDDVNRETNEITDRLDQIRDAVKKSAAMPGVFDMLTGAVTGATQQTHVRMRPIQLVLSADNVGATIISVQWGTRFYRYAVVGPLTLVLPPPQEIIDRGVDIDATVGAGSLVSAYFTYQPE